MSHLLRSAGRTWAAELLLASAAAAAEADPALGHKDFVPTPARPVGWRGDGKLAGQIQHVLYMDGHGYLQE